MPVHDVIVDLGLELQNPDLFGAQIADDLGFDRYPLDIRGADLDFVSVDGHQNMRELNDVPFFAFQPIEDDAVAGGCVPLFALRFKNQFHEHLHD